MKPNAAAFCVIAAIAELGGFVQPNSIPRPFRGLDGPARVAQVVREARAHTVGGMTAASGVRGLALRRRRRYLA